MFSGSLSLLKHLVDEDLVVVLLVLVGVLAKVDGSQLEESQAGLAGGAGTGAGAAAGVQSRLDALSRRVRG